MQTEIYKTKNKIRIVTAASLFDGHDAAINIMRRIIQASGAEVIHLGHNRSAQEIVECAIQEDVQAVALTSYQGGHMEFFTYIHDLLHAKGCGHIRIFGGGGGTILPSEIEELHARGITRIYSPDDGRAMGLQGMINDLLQKCDFPTGATAAKATAHLHVSDKKNIAQVLSGIENFHQQIGEELKNLHEQASKLVIPVLGMTGTGGAGKSSLLDELLRRFLADFPDKQVGIISVDPSKRKTGGALLGDRIRMNVVFDERVYMRSMATRQAHVALSAYVADAVAVLKAARFDLIIVETSGIGQSDSEVTDLADLTLYVMTPEYGASTQLEKIDMLDYADVVALNKFDKKGAQDALRDVKKQVQRNKGAWEVPTEQMPVVGTIASQFNDPGVDRLYHLLIGQLNQHFDLGWQSRLPVPDQHAEKIYIIPPHRTRYLSEISETIRRYNQETEREAQLAQQAFGLQQAIGVAKADAGELVPSLSGLYQQRWLLLQPDTRTFLEQWPHKRQAYAADEYGYLVRGKEIRVTTYHTSLSGSRIPKVALPKYEAWGELVRWARQENLPGEFPFTAGVFPFKRVEEDPTRMFAGEGGPERTNRRFHYLSRNQPFARLSTAFDSVTLYGEDPDHRPDIFGKIGNSGVSVCCLDDAKKLYSGFDLADPKTSVSMTINGPAATVCAFFLQTAIDQQCEKYILANGLGEEVRQKIQGIFSEKGLQPPVYQGDLPEGHNGLGLMLLGVTGDQMLPAEVYQHIKAKTLQAVRGTVQADILKEDQAQNTCIFSTEFSLRLMGDMQQYFLDHRIGNFYSVSISGYHIAEAGANPITQLAFTLSNGFTILEYYLSRGMPVDQFAKNLSFFFSNGIDPEYAVIGRVARRIWAKALKYKYGADSRAQQLKYHIQTSGRSLHAQEIGFNDIRTTLQALYAIYDNCNSLHTNAYDEAITTPTEESVRRAMAIQLIINKELGQAKNENPLQGAFLIEELTDLVEEAVMLEFDRLTERGGVMGAMETMYQRGKIQEESLHYEMLKHTGEYPIIGVNTFLSEEGSPTVIPPSVIRSTDAEKEQQIHSRMHVQQFAPQATSSALTHLQDVAKANGNLFDALMEAVKHCTLGQITHALYQVGGQYRRNM